MPDLDNADGKHDVRGVQRIHGLQPAVLLVEHNLSAAADTTALLESEGYSVYNASQTRDALQYIERITGGNGQIDVGQIPLALVLLGNLDKPDDAVALLEWLDACFETPPPVVLHTDLPHEQLYAMPKRIRAVGIVVSPSRPDDLLRFVGAALQVGAEKSLSRSIPGRAG